MYFLLIQKDVSHTQRKEMSACEVSMTLDDPFSILQYLFLKKKPILRIDSRWNLLGMYLYSTKIEHLTE